MRRQIFFLGLLLVLLAGCKNSSAPNSGNGTFQPSATPKVIVQSVTAGKEILQVIDLDNCKGESVAVRTEENTISVEATVSAEIAASVGVSAEVLSAEVQSVVGASLSQGHSRSMSIQLSAPPGTHMNFQIAWVGNEQMGVVEGLADVPIVFRSFVPYDVRIKDQINKGCPGYASPQAPVSPSVPPSWTKPTSTPGFSSVPTPFAVCPGRFETGKGQTVRVQISVPSGQVAYYGGWGFDGKYGGFFVTFNGPYEGSHSLHDGVYCPPVPANTAQSKATKEQILNECAGRCPTSIVLP